MNLSLTRYVGFAAAVAALSLTALAPAANAQFVNTVEGNPQIQLNNVAAPDAGGAFVGSLTSPFTIAAGSENASGFVRSAAYRNTNNLLDFYYQIVVTTTTGGITATNLSDFTGYSTQTAFNNTSDVDGAGALTSGGQRPFGSQRVSGGVVAFAFNGNALTGGGNAPGVLLSGQTSAVLIVRTNATVTTIGNGTVNGAAAANAPIIAPTVVPEAGTLALLLPAFALGAVAVIRRKK